MATLPSKAGYATLVDFSKSIDPDGKPAVVAELLAQRNDILTDMGWIEGNLPTGHRTTIRVGLPGVTWRQLYGGVQPTKSVRAQVDDACGILEARSEVDKDLADLNGNSDAFRLSEATAFLEAMNQAFTQTLFYGDTTVNPERFMGLAARYSLSTATNGQNVIKAPGVTANNNHSIWLIGWGQDTITGIFPKGSNAGLIHQDLGEIDGFDGSNNRFRALADRFQWKCGLSVRDWRYAVRICNIDQTVLAVTSGGDTAGTTIKLIELMAKAIARIPSLGACKPVFYCNRTVYEILRIQAMNKSVAALSLTEGLGQFTTTFMGIPIRLVDQLLNTEAIVS
jgi:hypothetical protein